MRARGRVSTFELPAVEVATVRTVDDDDAARRQSKQDPLQNRDR